MAGHPLDNPVWRALTSRHDALAEVAGAARRYHPDVAFFGAVERLDADGWAGLAELSHRFDGVMVAPLAPVEPPAGWAVELHIPGEQLVLGRLRPVPDEPSIRPLTVADVPAMLELTDETKPGPFLRRTVELGRYLGVGTGDRLIAMAGERVGFPGFTEISAVCTRPEARGRGLAAALTQAVARGIVERGEQPFLHVAEGNDNALRLYERLGFERRARLHFTRLKAPSDG